MGSRANSTPPPSPATEPVLGDVVAQLRAERGLTRQRLAQAAGVGVSTLYGIERSGAVPQSETLNLIIMAMASVAPITAADAARLGAATGRVPASFLASNRATAPRAAPTPKRDADLEEVEQVINELLAVASVDAVVRILRGIRDTLRAAGVARQVPAEPRRVRVVMPPRPGPIPGTVVEEYHHFDVYDDPEPGDEGRAAQGG